MDMKQRSVAILIFEGVELLDFAGPLEVFSSARAISDGQEQLMKVFTVAH
jgi:transcriptional regulator GlxA family with amidase domain